MKKVRLLLCVMILGFVVSSCELAPGDISPMNPDDIVLGGDMVEDKDPPAPPPLD